MNKYEIRINVHFSIVSNIFLKNNYIEIFKYNKENFMIRKLNLIKNNNINL